eukprot:1326401-Amphidinium_carterae.1
MESGTSFVTTPSRTKPQVLHCRRCSKDTKQYFNLSSPPKQLDIEHRKNSQHGAIRQAFCHTRHES